jgi:hypothetical protein
MSDKLHGFGCPNLRDSSQGSLSMLRPNQTQVDFAAKVPADLYIRFKKALPIYGATTFFINKALEEFVERLEDDPTLIDTVALSIDSMIQDRRELSDATASD